MHGHELALIWMDRYTCPFIGMIWLPHEWCGIDRYRFVMKLWVDVNFDGLVVIRLPS